MAAINVRAESLKVKLPLVILGAIVAALGWVLWWLIRHPWVTAVLGVMVSGAVVWSWYGPVPVVVVVVAVVGLLGAWRLVHFQSFQLRFWLPIKGLLRKHWIYRPQWAQTCATLKLTVKNGDDVQVPQILSVRSTLCTDLVRVRLLPGQLLDDFAKNADRLGATFQAVDARVRSVEKVRLWDLLRGLGARLSPRIAARLQERSVELDRRVVEVWFLTRDPLAEPTPLFPIPTAAKLNLAGLPIALREDGLPWLMRLIATHTLVVGATGAGKGSVLWSIVRALGDAIRTRVVELWMIDPKGGMEFAAGQRLFTRYTYGDTTPTADKPAVTGDDEDASTEKKARKSRKRDDPEPPAHEVAYAVFLEAAVEILRDRQSRLRGVLRCHKPAPGDPLIVLMIDEIASLTAYVTDRECKKRIGAALSIILSQGRAVGVLVIGAGQDARKDTIDMRGLFPQRIALRLTEAEDVDMVLGNGARDRGARCDEIPLSLPGVAYVTTEGVPEPVRVRFGYVDDAEIVRLCDAYAPGTDEPEATEFPENVTSIRALHEHEISTHEDESTNEEGTAA